MKYDQIKDPIKDTTPPIPQANGEFSATPFSQAVFDPNVLAQLKQQNPIIVSGIVQGANAATPANYGNFFVADKAYRVIAASEVHQTAGAGTAMVTVEKCNTGVAPDSGVLVLGSGFDLTKTANTPQFGTLSVTSTNAFLIKGDRLLLKDTGIPLTSVADVCVSVVLLEVQ